ncbi:hypothetical protein SDC9_179287 [bioreactor metagenome]|uniref:Ferric oxidoreductase domain-containing protein n=1 Tax=bioreactor metagenome TaxID=1076179 RepID=A0A645H0I4_9ZZZZ
MYKILGIISLILVIVITSPFWLRTLNSWTVKTKDKRFFNLLKFLRKLHKPLGLALAVLVIWHGTLAWGWGRLHTGHLALIGFLITVILGGAYYKLKNKKLFKAHKLMALISVLLLVLHRLWPSALFRIFGI